MTEYHRLDNLRISEINGDIRDSNILESILGMPVPCVQASREPVKRARREPARLVLVPPSAPSAYDAKFTIDLPDRQAAREFSSAFNFHLAVHFNGRERDYEQGEATYHYRGVRYLSIYIDYCIRNRLVPKKCLWNGDNSITFYLSDKKENPY